MPSKKSAPLKSKLLFFKQYMRKPFGIGSITPSSQKLALLMVEHLGYQAGDKVVELGPGTGVFTQALLDHGVPKKDIAFVEQNATFADHMRQGFPEILAIEGSAEFLPQHLQDIGFGEVARIVSGIPLRSLKPQLRKDISTAIAASLLPGGVAVQFSYVKQSPFPVATATAGGLTGTLVAHERGNLPPAYVWRYVKTDEA